MRAMKDSGRARRRLWVECLPHTSDEGPRLDDSGSDLRLRTRDLRHRVCVVRRRDVDEAERTSPGGIYRGNTLQQCPARSGMVILVSTIVPLLLRPPELRRFP